MEFSDSETELRVCLYIDTINCNVIPFTIFVPLTRDAEIELHDY